MIDDKIYDRFLNTIRDGEADVGTIDIRIDGRWQTIDFRPALARLVAERDDAIAQMNDADSATDNATQIAERVVRELRQEYVDVIDRLEKQSAAREATLHAENAQLRQQYENLIGAAANRDVARRQIVDDVRAENERLRAEVADERAESERLCSALEEVMGACGPACCADCDAYYIAKKALDDTKEKP